MLTIFACLLFVTSVTTSATSAIESVHAVPHKAQCTPYSIQKSGCYACACHENGFLMSCKPDGCGPILEENRNYSSYIFNDTKVCEPGARYKRDCNLCFCSLSGTSEACSLDECDPEDPTRIKKLYNPLADLQEGQLCRPKSIVLSGCYVCACHKNGKQTSCRPDFCDPKKPLTPSTDGYDYSMFVFQEKKICKPYSMVWKDCNVCLCGSSGTMELCSLDICDPNNPRKTLRPYNPNSGGR